MFHKVHTGNVPDATVFQAITQELTLRYRQLAGTCEHLTLIFDKGNNSQEAFDTLNGSGYHFIGSLVPTQHRELLAIPLDRFTPLTGARLEGVLAYRTSHKVFGQERTVLVTYNEHLLAGQLQGITANLEQTRRKLDA